MSCTTLNDKLDIEDMIKKPRKEYKIRDPEKVIALVHEVIKQNLSNRDQVKEYIGRREVRKKYGNVKLLDMLTIYRQLCQQNEFEYDPKYNLLFQTKTFRGQSGVIVIAVFTSPRPSYLGDDGEQKTQDFSCEYDCYYCPAEPNQPRSYLLKEPGVLRANENGFITTEQFWDRAKAYEGMGHPVDKIELLVLGGTWSSYPEKYQEDFIRDMFYAANVYFDPKRGTRELRKPLTIEEEQKINESALVKIIGLTLETRPDKITPRELKRFRHFGVTRIQMGVQHTNDAVLYRINRRCTSARTIKAIKLALDCGFKVDIHLMPDLPQPLKPGVNNQKPKFEPDDIDFDIDMYELDREMFQTVCNDPNWRVDQWKIYPCETTDWTRILEDFKNGCYKPYGDQQNKSDWTKLCDLLMEIKPMIPETIRVNRLIRDIPDEYIIGGNKDTNLRSKIQNELIKRGTPCRCIRCREVKGKNIDPSIAVLKVTQFESSGGMEYFLQYATPDEESSTIFGFLRLRLSHNSGKDLNDNIVFDELVDCAMIRELHVYGNVVSVDESNILADGKKASQHMGFGTKLINKAFEIARQNGYVKMSVISGVGVKNYYRRFGFEDEDYFMTCMIPAINNESNNDQIQTLKQLTDQIYAEQATKEQIDHEFDVLKQHIETKFGELKDFIDDINSDAKSINSTIKSINHKHNIEHTMVKSKIEEIQTDLESKIKVINSTPYNFNKGKIYDEDPNSNIRYLKWFIVTMLILYIYNCIIGFN